MNNDESKFSWNNAAAPAAAADEHDGGTWFNVFGKVLIISLMVDLLLTVTSDDDGSSKATMSDGW